MINEKKKIFLKCKDTNPYEFFWLNESLFQDTLQTLVEKDSNITNNSTEIVDSSNIKNETKDDSEKKICTIGYIIETNLDESEATLKYDNSIVKLDISRIKDIYKLSKDPFYIYGILKKKNNTPYIIVNIYRMLSSDLNFDAYKASINYQRKVVYECMNMN